VQKKQNSSCLCGRADYKLPPTLQFLLPGSFFRSGNCGGNAETTTNKNHRYMQTETKQEVKEQQEQQEYQKPELKSHGKLKNVASTWQDKSGCLPGIVN